MYFVYIYKLKKVKALQAFQKIWGVGPKKAEELEAAGFRTIEGIRTRGREKLNTQQLVGLDRCCVFVGRHSSTVFTADRILSAWCLRHHAVVRITIDINTVVRKPDMFA